MSGRASREPLPIGWAQVPIGTFARIVGGGTPPSKNPANFAPVGQGTPWITPADLSGYRAQTIERGARDLSAVGLAACGATLMPKGTVLFSSRAPIGYVAIAANEISTSQGFKSFVLPNGFDPRFTYYQLKHLKPEAEAIATGTTFKELSGSAAATLPFKVAPLLEQTRIADQLDKLLARIQACNDRLDAIPVLLKRFRQTVLDAATSGSLTEDWKPESKQTWTVVQLSDVASDFSYGSAAKSSKTGLIPVLRMGNIQDGRLDWTDLVFTSDPQEIDKYKLHKGDVLFNRTNSPLLVGKTAIYQGEREAIYAGYLIRVRCLPTLRPEYLNYCLGSKAGRAYCWSVKSDGVSQSNINAKKLAAFEFSLPSIQEQAEIICRVETLQKLADRIEVRYIAARNQILRLTPLVLSKAFRGELVPQDPQDESASVLLKRINENREKQVPQKTNGRAAKDKPMQNSQPSSLSEVISRMGEDCFTFDQLREVASRDYESLKDELFSLLADSKSGLKQVFDAEARVMKFKRVRK